MAQGKSVVSDGMNVLLIFPELPVSFWTLGELCRLHGKKAMSPPLGLLTVAALLPPEWNLRLVDLNVRPMDNADWNWADLVMVSGMLVQKKSLLEIVRKSKKLGVPVAAGGPYPTSLPEEVLLAGCDYLIKGEAEQVMGDVLAAVRAGRPGVFRTGGWPDLASSPVPRYGLVNLDDYWVVPLQTSRGCPYDCDFCDITHLNGRRPRYKRPSQVITEIEMLFRHGWRGDIFISDDNFIGDRERALEILHRIVFWQRGRQYPFRFETQLSIDLGSDDRMIDALVEAGFRFVIIGVESPDKNILAENRKYPNLKTPNLENLLNIRSRGLDVIANFIVGFDHEKPGIGRRIAKFVEASNIPIIYLNMLQALPGTKLWDNLDDQGRLLKDKTFGQTTGGPLNYVPDRPPTDIIDEYLTAYNALYDPEKYFGRAYRYAVTPAAGPDSTPIAKAATGPITIRKTVAVNVIDNLALLFRLLWRLGVILNSRRYFWKYFLRVLLNDPARFIKYLDYSAVSEDYFMLRDVIRQRVKESLS